STGAASASMPRYAIVINALRPLRAGVGAILLALSSLKHLKCLQTYTHFLGTGGTVTFRARDGEAELTRMYSQRVAGSPVRERTAGDGLQFCEQLRPSLLVIFGLKP
ncbi:hypothetical protein ACNPK5_22040, partial [Shewanella algae]|uniref:hypothetical protein n=1 Tax=Shewanella algae TaxID=38313 RepID=UPI003AAE501B